MPEWMRSIRSWVTLIITLTFAFVVVYGTILGDIKLEAKDITAVVMLIVAFYFTLKNRESGGGQ